MVLTPGGADVQGFEPVPRPASGYEAFGASVVHGIDAGLGSLPLADGVRYYVSVMAVDRAGNTAVQTSDGVLVDATSPEIGVVRDGAGASAGLGRIVALRYHSSISY